MPNFLFINLKTHCFLFFYSQSEVILYVNRLNTEESVIPYEYHHFDFCPIDESNSPVENLGQVVFGERIRPGPYKIQFLKDAACERVSSPKERIGKKMCFFMPCE